MKMTTPKKSTLAGTRSASAAPRKKPQQIADELRHLIITGDLAEGHSLGREPDLIERFGVARPSLREALRILEAEGLITVLRGVQGGVIVHRPDQRMTARTAALVLQTRNVQLADVFQARTIIEPAAVRLVASSRKRRSSARRLRALIAEEEAVIDDSLAFGRANARFHEELVALAGNQTLSIVAEMLNEIVERAVTAVGQANSNAGSNLGSTAIRKQGVRSQQRLASLVEAGDVAAAEEHWRTHMTLVGQIMLGQRAKTVIDLMNHF
jgi:DNA-binding FadR family transcriptional regulator